jgi:hypothetical protein
VQQLRLSAAAPHVDIRSLVIEHGVVAVRPGALEPVDKVEIPLAAQAEIIDGILGAGL